MTGRRIFVGDVQGCRDELERLLELVRFDPTCDVLHPVGDLVNRGPDSLGVLRLMRELEALSVLGNHDTHLLRVADGTRELRARDTLDDVLAAEDREDLLAWLMQQPFVREHPDLFQVHAAIHPAWADPVTELLGADPLNAEERTDFVTRVRYCAADGARPDADWPPPAASFAPWFEHWERRPGETRMVVFGHWARMGLVERPLLRGLDTGCVWGKELTAWIAEENRIVHAPAARVYSPTSLPD
jgi:bis(5'-nucleosyl)-tetraphosphatase (symmetrical)